MITPRACPRFAVLPSRIGVVCLVGTGIASPGAVLAQDGAPQCSGKADLAVWVGGSTIPLSQDRRVRLPYGRDLTLLVRTDPPAKDVTVRYQLTGARDGPRAASVPAERNGEGTCWAAALPRLHVNESGALGAFLFRPATFRSGRSAEQFTADLLMAFAASPRRLSTGEFAGVMQQAALTTVQANFQEEPGALRIRTGNGGSGERLDSAAASAATASLQYVNVFNDIRREAGSLERALDAMLLVAKGALTQAPACATATGLGGLRDAARALHDGGDSTISQLVVERKLPWPDCVPFLLQEARPEGAGIAPDAASEWVQDREAALESARALVNAEALRAVGLLASNVLAMSELATEVETINVPLGAGLLERYTQLDVVSAYVPQYGTVQAFATATLYLDADGADFAATVRPEGSLAGRDRWGVLLGYPVGSATVQSDTTFKPEVLAGVMWRANGVISLAGGKVFGRLSGSQRVRPWFVSINVDLSNLGPFQQLFARPDP